MKAATISKVKAKNEIKKNNQVRQLEIRSCANHTFLPQGWYLGRSLHYLEARLKNVINVAPNARAEVDGQVVDRGTFVFEGEARLLEYVRPEGVGEKASSS